jgi:hypothetical protein
MGRHLYKLQLEDAELLATLIANKTAELLTRSAVDILKLLNILQDAEPEPEPEPDDSDPEEARVIQLAEALLARHSSPLRRR